MTPIILDTETYGTVDLRECGSFVYAAHPDTRLLVVTWAEGDGPVNVWTHMDGTPPPRFVGRTLVAHNCQFDSAILERFGLVENCEWQDTAAQAAMCALPRGLDKAAAALGLDVRKDKRGRLLIQKLCKPQRPSKSNPHTDPMLRWPDYRELLNELAAYGEQDIVVCREVYRTLPKLPPQEAKIFDLTLRINERGVAVDLDAIRAATAFVERVTGDRGAVVKSITGFSHTQVGELLNWVNDRLAVNRQLESLDKATVSAALRRTNLPLLVREVLEIRRELAKSSTAKLESMLARANDDGRVRGSILYHGAGTGRWAGAGIQPQNYPQAKGLDMDDAVHAIHVGDVEWVQMVWGMEVPSFVSRALRGMLIAAPGHTLVGADFKSIEARVVLWLARDPGLKLFTEGADIYVEMAQDIDPANPNRQLGKQAVLGCGFGMGAPKFLDTCAKYGIEVDGALAERAVKAYRRKFFKVPQLWRALEDAAIAAAKNPGKTFQISPKEFVSIRYHYDGERFLTCTLPSGRKLYYPYPKLEPGKYGEQLTYMGVDSTTKAWRREHTYGGKLTENVVQAIARDLMALALLRLEAHGYPVVMTVHDEAVCEVIEAGGPEMAYVEEVMCELPDWAEGLPVEAEGFIGRRYS
jgi:DNA polymerase